MEENTSNAQDIWRVALLDALVEGVVTLDSQGHITSFNAGAERITGWGREEVLGQSCDLLFQSDICQNGFLSLLPPPEGQSKITVRLRNGQQVILAVTCAWLSVPCSESQTVLVLRDVTLEETHHRLMGNFLANVTHELRTPLAALAASLQLLMDQLPDLSVGELHELLGSLHLGMGRLQLLVDNLLESASIEAGHFRVYQRPCNVREIIAEAVFTVEPLLNKRNQYLILNVSEVLPPVIADFRRTVQVLVNLLGNASKYGPDGEAITVSVLAEATHMRITVADRGTGIPESLQPHLFMQYKPGDVAGQRGEVGVGLGLAVVKAIVEAQGGEVDLVAGEGAHMSFTLPILRADQVMGRWPA